MSRTSDLWARLDPVAEWQVTSPGANAGADDLSSTTVPAFSAASGSPAWSPKHQHFGFGVLLLATGVGLFYLFEGKPSGALFKGNVGPVEGEVGAGLGEE